MLPRHLLALIAIVSILPLAAPGALGVGAYVGEGPSTRSGGAEHCGDSTVVTLYPSVLSPGFWAAEITCVFAWPYNSYSTSWGYSGMPSHVMYELEGSPETGFFDSGTANSHGTSPGTLDWSITIGPIGSATEWSLDMVFHPDPDYLGTGSRASWWRGTADFVGASA